MHSYSCTTMVHLLADLVLVISLERSQAEPNQAQTAARSVCVLCFTLLDHSLLVQTNYTSTLYTYIQYSTVHHSTTLIPHAPSLNIFCFFFFFFFLYFFCSSFFSSFLFSLQCHPLFDTPYRYVRRSSSALSMANTTQRNVFYKTRQNTAY